MKVNCRCKRPDAPHPRGPCRHRYEDHPGVKGAARRDLPDDVPGAIFLRPDMGGEVAGLLERTVGKNLELACGHVAQVTQWRAYPHEGGIADGSGAKWWAYIRCPCGNESAAWKVERRIRELPAPAATGEVSA